MKIGIVGWRLGSNSFGVTIPYLDYIASFSNDYHILMPGHPYREDIELLILPGGPDINPVRYGAVPSYYTSHPCPFREWFDTTILPAYVRSGTPIFGICRGFQSLVVHFGGDLVQEHYHETNTQTEGRSKKVHPITLTEQGEEVLSKLEGKTVKRKKIEVNSLHHQVANPATFPIGEMAVLAHHPDNTPEVICHRTLPIAGVQYHPEELLDDPFANLFLEWFVERNTESPLIVEETEEKQINVI